MANRFWFSSMTASTVLVGYSLAHSVEFWRPQSIPLTATETEIEAVISILIFFSLPDLEAIWKRYLVIIYMYMNLYMCE